MKDHTVPHLIDGDTPTPGGPLPVINEKTRVGFNLQTWGAIIVCSATAISVGVSFAIWLTVMHDDVQTLIKSVGAIQEDIRALKDRKP